MPDDLEMSMYMVKYQFAKGLHFTPREVDNMTAREIQAFITIAQEESKKDEMKEMGHKHHMNAVNRLTSPKMGGMM